LSRLSGDRQRLHRQTPMPFPSFYFILFFSSIDFKKFFLYFSRGKKNIYIYITAAFVLYVTHVDDPPYSQHHPALLLVVFLYDTDFLFIFFVFAISLTDRQKFLIQFPFRFPGKITRKSIAKVAPVMISKCVIRPLDETEEFVLILLLFDRSMGVDDINFSFPRALSKSQLERLSCSVYNPVTERLLRR